MIIYLCFLLVVLICGCCQNQANAGTFEVDYTNNCFLKDGKPFRYISGEIHYFRIHPGLWNDRLKRVRAMGLNAVQVYVPWNLHEPTPGNFDFSDGLDLAHFLQLAQRNQLVVNLRAGPYICAEWENGGLPWWLLKYEGIQMRTSDQNYINHVLSYYNKLLSIVKPLLYKNGGPILMIQVENEYGSFYACDHNYTAFLRDVFRGILGNDTVLYTTDGAGSGMLRCGSVPGTFTTVDFGVSDDSGIDSHFKLQYDYSHGGPKVNSEYYPGWFVEWGQTKQSLPTPQQIIPNIAHMYAVNASFSIYMIHGGTNFGFQNGAEVDAPIVTSYDYGAPISENGDITPLYQAIRTFIKNLTDWEQPPYSIPNNNPAANYGQVQMKRIGTSLVSTITQLQEICWNSTDPLSFEDINHGYGFVLYTNVLKSGGRSLSTPNIKDYGFVFVDNVYQGFISRDKPLTITLSGAQPGSVLRILVENRGRQNFETVIDRKGLHSNVTLDGQLLQSWFQCGINLTKPAIDSLTSGFYEKEGDWVECEAEKALSSPGVYVGQFDASVLQDTFFNSSGWGKGQLFVNGFNVGRYWPQIGPQITLYVPGPIIQPKNNTVLLIELLGAQQNYISFVNQSIYDFKSFNFGVGEWQRRLEI